MGSGVAVAVSFSSEVIPPMLPIICCCWVSDVPFLLGLEHCLMTFNMYERGYVIDVCLIPLTYSPLDPVSLVEVLVCINNSKRKE